MSEGRNLTERQRQDFEDQQNEIAGRDVGRARRFLTQDDASSSDAQRRKRAARAFQRTLEMLLQDPIYRARYEAAQQVLGQAERATETVLQRLADMITQAEIDLQDMRDRAARLPDGTIVFRDQDGVVRHEDGSSVDETLAATILWTGREPSYEAFADQSRQLERMHADQLEIETYQTNVLGDARNRLSDDEDPSSLEEIDAIVSDIEIQMPNSVRLELDAVQVESQPTPTSLIPLPSLRD